MQCNDNNNNNISHNDEDNQHWLMHTAPRPMHGGDTERRGSRGRAFAHLVRAGASSLVARVSHSLCSPTCSSPASLCLRASERARRKERQAPLVGQGWRELPKGGCESRGSSCCAIGAPQCCRAQAAGSFTCRCKSRERLCRSPARSLRGQQCATSNPQIRVHVGPPRRFRPPPGVWLGPDVLRWSARAPSGAR